MHQTVLKEFERILATEELGEAVLEIGATPSTDTLLELGRAREASRRVGLNLTGPHSYRGFEIPPGNANDMDMFADGSFDTVLCNAVLEHDPPFWLTLAEIRRVTRPGGLVVLGTPGYSAYAGARRIRRVLRRIPGMARFAHSLVSSTPTLNAHKAPGDYYRFSPTAFTEVFFEGFLDVRVTTVMTAPRVIGNGREPAP